MPTSMASVRASISACARLTSALPSALFASNPVNAAAAALDASLYLPVSSRVLHNLSSRAARLSISCCNRLRRPAMRPSTLRSAATSSCQRSTARFCFLSLSANWIWSLSRACRQVLRRSRTLSISAVRATNLCCAASLSVCSRRHSSSRSACRTAI